MKKTILISTVLAALTFTGCTDSMTSVTPKAVYQAPTPEKSAKFNPILSEVAHSTKTDPNYHRMSLKTAEDKKWFHDQTYRLWDRQITKSQFVSDGVVKYPGHKYEFNFVANGIQARS